MRTGIVAFSFGVPHSLPCNRQIAQIALGKAREFHAPIFTQLDVRINDSRIDVTYLKEKLGEPSPTLRIARGAVRWAQERGISELVVVAATPHIDRAARDMKEAIREAKATIVVRSAEEEVMHYSGSSWFSPDSITRRTRTQLAWYTREFVLWSLPLFLYKWITK